MSYGWGGFFGDMAESGLKTYTSLENTKRARHQDQREQERSDREKEQYNKQNALDADLTTAGSDLYAYNGPDLPPTGGSTTKEFSQQFTPAAMQGFGDVPPAVAPTPQAPAPSALPAPQASPVGNTFAQAFSPQAMAGLQGQQTLTPQAALPTPAPTPEEMVSVRDPFTHEYHQVPKAMVREKSLVERGRDLAAVYMAHGQSDKAFDTINKSLEAALNQKTFDKREVADTLAQSRANPVEFAKALTAANQKAGVNIDVSVEVVGGQPVLKYNQAGSAAPPFYMTPTGELSTKPIPGSYGVQSAAIISGINHDPLEVYRDVVTSQAQIQSMALARNQDRRADNADNREGGLYGLRREGMVLENQGRAISNEGGMIQNEGGRLGNASATAEYQANYGLPPSGHVGPMIEDTAMRAVPGAGVTSRVRSAARNKAVGGVSDSFHKTDDARDFVPGKGGSMGDLHAKLRQAFPANQFDVINEGDHVHVEPNGQLAQQVRGGKAYAKQREAWQEKFTSWVDKNAAPDGSDAAVLRESYLKIHPEAAPYLVARSISAEELGGGTSPPAPAAPTKAPPKQQARTAIPVGPRSVASASPYYAAIPNLFPRQEPGKALVGKAREAAWQQSKPAGGLILKGR